MHFRSSDFPSCTFLIFVILVAVFFIIGVLGGLTVGALVVYDCFKWKLSHQSKHRLPPSSPPPPAPLYDDIEISIKPPVFATTLSFSADTARAGDSVSCKDIGGQTSRQTIQVQMSKIILNSYT